LLSISVQNFVFADVTAQGFDVLADADHKVRSVLFGYAVEASQKFLQILQLDIGMLQDAVDKDDLDVVILADDPIKKADVFIDIRHVLEILHAHHPNTILQIVHQPVIFVDEHNASVYFVQAGVGHINHLFGLATAFVAYE
jgi:hypothetical protein